MGRQVNFTITDTARDLLVGRLTSQGAVLLPWSSPTREFVPLTADAGRRAGWAARPQDLDRITVRYVETQGYWTVMGSGSPILECDLVGRRHEEDLLGRLWYSTGAYDDSGTWIRQDQDFAAWADRQIAWVRRRFRRGAGALYEAPADERDGGPSGSLDA